MHIIAPCISVVQERRRPRRRRRRSDEEEQQQHSSGQVAVVLGTPYRVLVSVDSSGISG